MSHEIARHWRLRNERYKMQGEKCPHCETAIFPPRDLCPDCGQDAKEPFNLSGKGKVYSFTVVHNAPEGFKDMEPYAVALIELEEGPFITAQLTDVNFEKIEIGMPVEMVTRVLKRQGEKGQILYGYKFRPLLEKAPEKKAA